MAAITSRHSQRDSLSVGMVCVRVDLAWTVKRQLESRGTMLVKKFAVGSLSTVMNGASTVSIILHGGHVRET